MTDDLIEKMVKAMDMMIAEDRNGLAMGDYEGAASRVDGIIKTHGLKIGKDSPEYKTLSREVLKADIAIWNVEKARTVGDYSSPEEKALKLILDPTHWSLPNQGSGSQTGAINQPQKQTSATVKQVADDFFEEFNRDWKPRSRTDYQNALDQWLSLK